MRTDHGLARRSTVPDPISARGPTTAPGSTMTPCLQTRLQDERTSRARPLRRRSIDPGAPPRVEPRQDLRHRRGRARARSSATVPAGTRRRTRRAPGRRRRASRRARRRIRRCPCRRDRAGRRPPEGPHRRSGGFRVGHSGAAVGDSGDFVERNRRRSGKKTGSDMAGCNVAGAAAAVRARQNRVPPEKRKACVLSLPTRTPVVGSMCPHPC